MSEVLDKYMNMSLATKSEPKKESEPKFVMPLSKKEVQNKYQNMKLNKEEKKETSVDIEEHLKKLKQLKASGRDIPGLDAEISKREKELNIKLIEEAPDEVKVYRSEVLNTTMRWNQTKGIIVTDDGAIYTEKEIEERPRGLGDDKIRFLHKMKLMGFSDTKKFEEFKDDKCRRVGFKTV